MKKAEQSLKREGGIFRRLDNLGLRPLAYRMKQHGKWNEYGRYLRLRVQASPHCLKEVQERLNVEEDVIRTLTLKMPLAPQGPPTLSTKQLRRNAKKALRQAELDEIKQEHDESSFTARFKTLDFYASQALFRAGVISAEELEQLPR